MTKSVFITLALASCITIADNNRMAHERLQPENAPPTLEQVSRLGYALGYDPSRRQPLWVAYRLRKEDVEGELVEREDCFKHDGDVSNSPWPNEYNYSEYGYDRGHMAPAGDMEYDREIMRDSFFMSNMSPQVPYINRVVWRKIEDFTRKAAKKFGEIFVITGPVFLGDEGFLPSPSQKQEAIKSADGDIPIPVAFYKVLYTRVRGGMLLAFLVENSDEDEKVRWYEKREWMETAPHRTKTIEQLTGFRFFPDVDSDDQDGLRDECDISFWQL